jgi:AraC-like DNA-binding protein
MASLLIEFGIGFSLLTSVLLVLVMTTNTHDLPMPPASRVGGGIMLAGLCHTQWIHFQALRGEGELWGGFAYALILVVQSAGFYWLLLGMLRPPRTRWHFLEWSLPLLPALVVTMVPIRYRPVVALAAGVAISVHIGMLLHRVRTQRRHFRIELRTLAVFGLMAVALVGLGFSAPALDWPAFAAAYAVLVSAGFMLVLYLLLRFPDLARKTEEAVTAAYAVSTLGKVDIERVLAMLRRSFEEEHVYRDQELSLSRLAEQLDLSGHQLSELINTQLDTSFPRLVRQYRIEAAKRMLIDEPRASVLSVGLSVGFNSQSGFYSAFKDVTGTVPSQYRTRPDGANTRNPDPPTPS